MDLRSHFAAMWRHKWVVLAASVLLAVGVYFGTSREAKTYQASAQLGVTPGTVAAGGAAIQDAAPFLASTYANLAKTAPIVAAAAKDSGLGIDELTAEARISTTASTTLGVITVSATGPSRSDALRLDAAIATALVNAVKTQQAKAVEAQLAPIQAQVNQITAELNNLPANASQRADLETELQALIGAVTTQQLQSPNQINVQSPAQAGVAPISPTPKRDTALGFLTGLVVFAELSVAYEVVSDRLVPSSLDEEVRRLTGLPVLAHIPRGNGPGQVEAFRTLRTSLLFSDTAEELHTIAIVSSQVGAGKTFVSVNLASALAELDVPVVLVDGDMRRPALDVRLNLPRTPGMSEVLFGESELAAAMRPHATSGGGVLLVLPAGRAVADPPGLLSSQFPSRVLEQLKEFQTVLVDTPAESLFPDSSVIASYCDRVLVVVNEPTTKRRHLRALIDHLHQVQAKPVGVVVNRTTGSSKDFGYYYARAEEKSGPEVT